MVQEKLAMKGSRSSCPVITREAAATILESLTREEINVWVPAARPFDD